MLGRLHDAYLATLIESGQTQTSAATTLLVIVGGKNATALARQVERSGIRLSNDRILAVMQDGAELAHATLLGLPLSADHVQHSRNVEWLGDAAHRTACRDSIAASDIRAPSTNEHDVQQIPDEVSGKLRILRIAAIAAGLALTAFLVKKVRASYLFRVHQNERLPRTAISVELELTMTDADGVEHHVSATALDLSAGGMKLDWPNPAAPGTPLVISLPFGETQATVIWSNAFYAGIMFDNLLNEEQMDALREESPAQTKENGARKRRVA